MALNPDPHDRRTDPTAARPVATTPFYRRRSNWGWALAALTGTLDLAPVECTSRVVFAALVPRGQLTARTYRVKVPE